MSVKLLTDLANMIEDAAIAPADEIVTGRLSDATDVAVQIRDYGGRPPSSVHDGRSYRYPRVQVLVRHTDPVVARERAEAIYDLFLASQSWNTTEATHDGLEYQVIVPLGDLTPISHDIARRTNIAANYEVRHPNE